MTRGSERPAGCIALACLFILVPAALAHTRVGVILGAPSYRQSHSLYLRALESKGYDLDIRGASDQSLRLRDWDEWLYDKVVILAGTASEFGGAVDVAALMEFADAGNDLLMAVHPEASDELREFASEVGVDLEPKGRSVIDHINYVVTDPEHTLVATDKFIECAAIMGDKPIEGPVLFRGTAMSISPESELAVKVLSAPESSFVHTPGKNITENPSLAGMEIVLAAAVQARNNARVVIVGSTDLFSNSFMRGSIETNRGIKYAATGNAAFADALTTWAFHERGSLRASNLRHHKGSAPGIQPNHYRINDELVFLLDVEERKNGRWLPFQTHDMQVEFVMMDPYVRQFLVPSTNGTFSTLIKVPDVYGIYKFVVDYRRIGYSNVQLSHQVPVQPYHHNEYERFLTAAYPYYSSVTAMMASFLVFSFVFLYHKDRK